jgi:hypothetical protein
MRNAGRRMRDAIVASNAGYTDLSWFIESSGVVLVGYEVLVSLE